MTDSESRIPDFAELIRAFQADHYDTGLALYKKGLRVAFLQGTHDAFIEVASIMRDAPDVLSERCELPSEQAQLIRGVLTTIADEIEAGAWPSPRSHRGPAPADA
jgi:hypothetical protein